MEHLCQPPLTPSGQQKVAFILAKPQTIIGT
jgi:hypothetical protein